MLPGTVANGTYSILFSLFRSGVAEYAYFYNYVNVTQTPNIPTTNTSNQLTNNTAGNFSSPVALYSDASATFSFTDYYWNVGSGSSFPADYEQSGFFEAQSGATTAHCSPTMRMRSVFQSI